MSRTSSPAARIGILLAENNEHEEVIARLRQRPVSNAEQRLARELEIAQVSLRVQRNQLDILECQIALQEARLSRYDAVAPDDPNVPQTARILRRGLATLHANRATAERRLRRAEADLDRLVIRYQTGRSDHAAGADRQ